MRSPNKEGRTKLGKLLSNFAHTPIDLLDDGHFESVEGYWYWLSTGDDKLRKLSGYQAKKTGRLLRGEDWPDIPGFKNKIRAAISAKIKQHPRIAKLLEHSTLPLAHYYVFNGMVKEVPAGNWILKHITETRSKLKEGEQEQL